MAAALRQTDELVLWNKEILKAIQEKLPALYKDYGIPDPYLAVLVADGDGMGEILSDCQSPQQHQAISSALNDFAEAARTAIRQRFHGVCIFAGGEDILALLPLTERCAVRNICAPVIAPALLVAVLAVPRCRWVWQWGIVWNR